jgi:hypothetical protein
MAINTTRLAALAASILALIPAQVSIAGATAVTGTRTKLRREAVVATPGLEETYELSVLLPVSAYSGVPASGLVVAVDGVSYRLLGAELDPAKSSLRLDLGGLS